MWTMNQTNFLNLNCCSDCFKYCLKFDVLEKSGKLEFSLESSNHPNVLTV